MLNSTVNNNIYLTYKQTAVETATPDKLLLMLYDGGIKFLRFGEKAILEKDYAAAHKWLTKVQDILTELMITLDMEQGEIPQNLFNLYEFYRYEVQMANVKKDTERLQPVIEFFVKFRDVWAEAAKKALVQK
ncbi:flagellar export chaperone FliS [Paradesulfitobacterium ferrireducens]|uniref:flagellar export chaperone FliS n=1 Tax=Paradesulfitobacterium ferrireducens TaxID=2816476 RepID=UPI001A8F5BBE|nr:flagellar export chaperone FliS [Paradesulfitobacterium ferrireducens]